MRLPSQPGHDSPAARRLSGANLGIEIHAKEILHTKKRLNEILARHTGQDVEKVRHDTERDKFPLGPRSQGIRHRRPRDHAA